MEKEMIGKAAELLAKCEVVTLASITEDGYPRICVMAKVKTEGIRTIWMATGSHSAKTGHFQKNPKASVCYYAGCNSVTLLEQREPVLEAGPWVSRPVAQFRYAPDSGVWTLYGADRNGRWLGAVGGLFLVEYFRKGKDWRKALRGVKSYAKGTGWAIVAEVALCLVMIAVFVGWVALALAFPQTV